MSLGDAVDPASLDWDKGDGLLPAIVQDAVDGSVLMLGYMNREALARTLAEGKVTFYSRSRQQLWQKGETSGNVLELVTVSADCDRDTLRVQARPSGPTCHLGTRTCFAGDTGSRRSPGFLGELEDVIRGSARGCPRRQLCGVAGGAGPATHGAKDRRGGRGDGAGAELRVTRMRCWMRAPTCCFI